MAETLERTVWLGADPDRVRQTIAQTTFDWVLTPTRQAARAIGLKGAGQSLVQLLGRLRLDGRIAPMVQRQRALRSAVAQVWPGVDPIAHANAIAPTIRELLQNGLDLVALAANETVSERARQLAKTALNYVERLGDRIDPAQQLWFAEQAIAQGQATPLPLPLKLALWGDGQLGPDAIALLDRLAGPGSCLWLPAHPALDRALADLQQRGWTIASATPANPAQPQQRAIAFPTLEDEVRWVLARVKQHLNDGVPANEIVLVTRDEQRYGPKLLEVAQEFELPVRLLYGVPLSETRVGSWAQTLLEAVQQNWDYEATVRLLRHAVVRDQLDERWAEVRRWRPDRLPAWEGFAPEIAALAPRLKKGRTTRDAWVQWVQDCARSLGVRAIAQAWPREANAFSRLDQHIVELARPSEELLTVSEFAQELRDLLGLVSVAMHPGRGGVELHNPASLLGARYRYGFGLGVVETWWPAPIAPNWVLDWFDRRDLTQAGFPMASTADLANQERLHNGAALAAVHDTLILSYPNYHDGKAQAPSALLEAIEPMAAPPVPAASPIATWRQYLAQTDRPALLQTDPLRPWVEHAWRVECQRLQAPQLDRFAGHLGDEAATDPDDHWFSASQITDLGQCPFKYFARRVLRLHEPAETEADLPHNSKGSLYHRVLQKLGEAWRDRPDCRPSALLDRLDSWLDEAATELQLPRYLTWTAQRQELLAQLRWLVNQDNFLPHEREILHCELDFTGEWQGLKVRGVIDRVDRSPDGLVFIDYKTGEAKGQRAKDSSGKAKLDVQLLVYASAAQQIDPDLAVANAYYYSIRDGEQKKATNQADDPSVQALIERLRTHLSTGSYPVEPDRDYQACNFCEAGAACRCVQP
jgi:RecB family exonuclease